MGAIAKARRRKLAADRGLKAEPESDRITMLQLEDVRLEVGHASVPTDKGNETILQRFVTLLYD